LLDVPLFPNGLLNLTGTVINHSDGQPVNNASVWLYGAPTPSSTTTDAMGAFNFNNIKAGIYNITAGAPGLGMGMLSGQTIVGSTGVTIELFTTLRKDAMNDGIGLSEQATEQWRFTQNPFTTETLFQYQFKEAGATITFLNSLGQIVQTAELSGSEGQMSFGTGLPAGIYFAVLQQDGKEISVKKLVKS
jgi:hypothetical protein